MAYSNFWYQTTGPGVNKKGEWERSWETLTAANRMDSTAGSTDFLVLLHSIDEQTNSFRPEVHIAVERQ